MKLSQIKLSGFKSFVDSTTIDINGQLVGIVGPNGCGKSNVIDAVRWVLGESSARQLRGDTMQDVIFNGSVSRRAISRASVELVFINNQQILSDMWNSYSEISIKRILARNGESLYYINNQIVRRRDITELFLGTGVGSKGYAVIEQGMISRIIEAKPEELRVYLEEAAGVSKYREKRKETLSRLDYTRENLVRLNDICSELVQNIEKLTEQAHSARQYQDLNQELKQLQLIQLLLKVDKSKIALVEVNEQIAKYEHILATNTSEQQLIEDKLTIEFAAKEQYIPVLSGLNEGFNRLRFTLGRLEERQKNNYERQAKIADELVQLTMQKKNIYTHIDELKQVHDETLLTANFKAEQIVEQQLIKEEKLVSYSQLEQTYFVSNKEVAQAADHISQAKHELNLLNNTLSHKKQQLNTLNARLAKLQQETAANTLDLDQTHAVTAETMTELTLTLEQLLIELEDNKHKQLELERLQADRLTKINQHKNQVAAVSAKIQTFNQLLAGENTQHDLTDIITNVDRQSRLWQGIEVEAGYEMAVEIALGNLLSALPLTSLQDVAQIPQHILTLWLSSANVVMPKGNLSDKVKIKDTNFQALYVLLNQYTIAENLAMAENYLAQGQAKIITLDGHLLTPEYIVLNANVAEAHMLEYHNQINELELELTMIEEGLVIVEDEYSQNQLQLSELKQTISIQGQQHQVQQKQLHKLNLELTRQEQNHLHFKQHQERVILEIKTISHEIEFFDAELARLILQIEEQTQSVVSYTDQHALVQKNHTQHVLRYNEAKDELKVIDLQLNELQVSNQLLHQQATLTKQQIDDKQMQLKELEQRLVAISDESEELATEVLTQELRFTQDQLTDVTLKISQQNDLLTGVNQKIKEYQDQLSKSEQNKSKTREMLNQSLLHQQEHSINLHNDQESIAGMDVADYDVTTLFANNRLNSGQIQYKIAQLKLQIEDMGLVNLKAIEDLSQAQEKYDNLNEQIADLTSAITLLEQAIIQIDSETRTMLNTTYLKVSETFNVYFRVLFGGGSAKLELTEKDILNSGLQIFAEPLGKKNSSIHLLSGGEKALTAMSLVFALFNLNPAPFCILDEVDAPLDDANTERFCKLVKELSARTQFIFISHNRLTMEIAEQLVGITMQEKGVSTTVSVALVDANSDTRQ